VNRRLSVLVAHNPVGDDADPSTRDVLDQVALVVSGLELLGLRHRTVPLADGAAADHLEVGAGEVVFNLFESPPGAARLQVEVASALERRGIPYTGSDAVAIWLTTDKLATRERLAANGLPVADGGRLDPGRPEVLDRVPAPWIVKPAWEDASLGLENGGVCDRREAAVARAAELERLYGGEPVLVEHLLPGREFNLSLLDGPGGVEVLPAAEMVYVDFPAEMPRVLGFEAKWDHDSFAYTHTVRRFLDGAGEPELERELEGLARAAYQACGLSGYARVDLRLDEAGRPCILEVNANPCLSADAGFMAAAGRAGLDAAAVVARVLAAVEVP
jgi:D-alanine-D-alanine ligase